MQCASWLVSQWTEYPQTNFSVLIQSSFVLRTSADEDPRGNTTGQAKRKMKVTAWVLLSPSKVDQHSKGEDCFSSQF